MDTGTEQMEMKKKLKQELKKHWKIFAIVVLVAALAVTASLLRSSRVRQQEVEEQLARQSELVEALMDKREEKEPDEKVTISTDTLKSQIVSVRELATQEYIYTNADKRESAETWMFGWTRPFSENVLLVTYDGSIKAGVDLGQVEIGVDEETHTITITLPPSTIIENNIPQESIEVVAVKDGLFNPVTFDDYNEFIAGQKLVMEQRAIDQGLLTKADEEARTLVRSVLSALPGMDQYTLVIETAQ